MSFQERGRAHPGRAWVSAATIPMSEEDLQPLDGSDIEASTDAELARALETYLSAMERGLSVDLDRLVAEHPAIADELRSCLRILRRALLDGWTGEEICRAEGGRLAASTVHSLVHRVRRRLVSPAWWGGGKPAA